MLRRDLIDREFCKEPPRNHKQFPRSRQGYSDATSPQRTSRWAAGLADVDAVVAIGGVANDPLVFFVESVHGRPALPAKTVGLRHVARLT
jgi:hypothetical protein